MYKKILITGNAGSGKTTLSYKLAKLLDIKSVIHLDQIVWEYGWQPVSKEKRDSYFYTLIKMESWIVDGVSKIILSDADTIIFLDYPRYICYFRALKRTFKYAFRSRPELSKQSPEIFVLWKLLKIIWNFQKTVKPGILKHLAEYSDRKSIYHIRNNNDLMILLDKMNNQSITLCDKRHIEK